MFTRVKTITIDMLSQKGLNIWSVSEHEYLYQHAHKTMALNIRRRYEACSTKQGNPVFPTDPASTAIMYFCFCEIVSTALLCL